MQECCDRLLEYDGRSHPRRVRKDPWKYLTRASCQALDATVLPIEHNLKITILRETLSDQELYGNLLKYMLFIKHNGVLKNAMKDNCFKDLVLAPNFLAIIDELRTRPREKKSGRGSYEHRSKFRRYI